MVTAVAAGTANITVTTEDGGHTATCAVTVTNATVAVTGVTLDQSTLAINTGATATLVATVNPTDATNKNVTWSSDNTAIATVDANGMVTAVAAGVANITVTTEDGSFTASSEVTVANATVAVTGVTLDQSTLSLAVDGTATLVATVNPTDATNKNVTWSSDNTGIATVDANGVVTAIAAGSATITVTTEDGSFTDQSMVTVS